MSSIDDLVKKIKSVGGKHTAACLHRGAKRGLECLGTSPPQPSSPSRSETNLVGEYGNLLRENPLHGFTQHVLGRGPYVRSTSICP